MVVTTERARYKVDEEARGKFRLTTIEVLAPFKAGRAPCLTGRWAFHETRRGGAGAGSSIVVNGLVLRIGANLTFSTGDLLPTPDEPCCGFTNRILSIEP